MIQYQMLKLLSSKHLNKKLKQTAIRLGNPEFFDNVIHKRDENVVGMM